MDNSPVVKLLLDLAPHVGGLGLHLLGGRLLDVDGLLVIGVDDKGSGLSGGGGLLAAAGSGSLLDAAAGSGALAAFGRGGGVTTIAGAGAGGRDTLLAAKLLEVLPARGT